MGLKLRKILKDDWIGVRQNFDKIKTHLLGPAAVVTHAGLTLSDLTDGRVIYAGAGGTLSDDGSLLWNNSTKILTTTGLTVTGCSVLGLNSAVFQPITDSTTFWRVNDKDGNVIVNVDTVNNRVGFGTNSPGKPVEIFSSASVLRLRGSGATANATTAFVEFGGTDGGNWNRTGYVGDSASADTHIRLRATDSDLILGDSTGASVLTLSGGNAVFSGTVTGTSFITAGNIGVVADTDLLQLAANTLTVNGTITLPAANKINFRDSDIFIGSAFDGKLDIGADISVGFFYDNADVGNEADGQSVYINRMAAEGDDYLQFYIDSDRYAIINANQTLKIQRQGSTLLQLAANAVTVNGTLSVATTCTSVGGANFLRVTGLQTDGTAMTGTLRGAYIDVSNGSTAAAGTIRGMELKARTEAPGDTGNDVNVLEGLSISADSKGHSVTTMRAAEFILDGSAGGTITEAVGLRIANNLQADKATISYGLQIYRDSFDYTADIQLSDGSIINKAGKWGINTGSPGATLDVRGSAIFNEAGGDYNFRIEGDTEPNLFFVDASVDCIGIGNAIPDIRYLFHVKKVYSDASAGTNPHPIRSEGHLYFGDGSWRTVSAFNAYTVLYEVDAFSSSIAGYYQSGLYDDSTMATAQGFLGCAVNFSSGTMTTAVGVEGSIRGSGASSGTIITGIDLTNHINRERVNFTTHYGLYLNNPIVTAGYTFTNKYGIYVADITGGTSTNYAIYSAGGLCYFAGLATFAGAVKIIDNVGFFNTTPVAQEAHIINADGQLADITTKFNTLLASLETYGLLAAA